VDQDEVFKALADAHRRRLDALFQRDGLTLLATGQPLPF
jgi:hypothetical protein